MYKRQYQDASSVYVVFELLRGGDLHHRLRALGTLGEPDCRFYMGQVVDEGNVQFNTLRKS